LLNRGWVLLLLLILGFFLIRFVSNKLHHFIIHIVYILILFIYLLSLLLKLLLYDFFITILSINLSLYLIVNMSSWREIITNVIIITFIHVISIFTTLWQRSLLTFSYRWHFHLIWCNWFILHELLRLLFIHSSMININIYSINIFNLLLLRFRCIKNHSRLNKLLLLVLFLPCHLFPFHRWLFRDWLCGWSIRFASIIIIIKHFFRNTNHIDKIWFLLLVPFLHNISFHLFSINVSLLACKFQRLLCDLNVIKSWLLIFVWEPSCSSLSRFFLSIIWDWFFLNQMLMLFLHLLINLKDLILRFSCNLLDSS